MTDHCYLIFSEKWTSFALEMDAIFDSGEYEKAGQRLKVNFVNLRFRMQVLH